MRKREVIENKVRKCYERKGEVLLDHHDIFDQPVDEFVKERTTSYLLG